MSFSLKPYAKAVAAFASAAAAGIVAALLPDSPGGATIVVAEWIAIASTTIVATVAVYSVPNVPPGPITRDQLEG